MSLLDRSPENTNLQQASKFQLVFSRLPTVVFFCQSVVMPGISLSKIDVEYSGGTIKVPGDKIVYDDLEIEFLIDENLVSWKELHTWFKSIGTPLGSEERNRFKNYQEMLANEHKNPAYYSDAVLTLLTNLNNPNNRIEFKNIHPISISAINFDTKKSAEDVLTATARFSYDYYDITNA